MPTTISVQSNVSLNRPSGPEMALPSSVRTVEDLLRHVGEEIDFLFLDAETGKLRPDIDILVNGKQIEFYTEGLQRLIRNRDSVEITLIPLGGG